VFISYGDGDKIGFGQMDISLAIVVLSPGGDGAIKFEAQTVVRSGSDGDKAAVQIGPDDLVAPAENPACLLGRSGRLGNEDTHESGDISCGLRRAFSDDFETFRVVCTISGRFWVENVMDLEEFLGILFGLASKARFSESLGVACQ